MGRVAGWGGGEGQPGRLGRGSGVREEFGGRQVDNNVMKIVWGEGEDGEELLGEGEWSSQPTELLFEGMTCAALAGRAPASRKGSGRR